MSDDLNATVVANIRRELAWRPRGAHRRLARELGITPNALSRRLNGHVPLTVPELSTIAAALGVSPSALLDPGQRPTETEES